MANIQIKGLDRLMKIADRYPSVAGKHIGYAINRSLVRILGIEKQEAPVGVTGHLRDRWSLRSNAFSGSLTSLVSYSVAVHEGSKPHYVSAQTIAPWARKKGLNPFAVSKSIAKKGTKANPFLTRTLDIASRNVDIEFKDALVKITKEIA